MAVELRAAGGSFCYTVPMAAHDPSADRSPEQPLVLGYAPRSGRGAWRRRIWPWVRPGSVLFFVIVAGITVGAGWGMWKWNLAEDRKAFMACAQVSSDGSGGSIVYFNHPPARSALRHLSRLPGPIFVYIYWPAQEDAGAAEAFHGADLSPVTWIVMGNTVNADLLLKELARPDCGLKALTRLGLRETQVTDAGLKQLSRPDCGLKALTRLGLGETQVTDAGLKQLSRPDCGLKALTVLYLDGTPVTSAGVQELQAARPGLKIFR